MEKNNQFTARKTAGVRVDQDTVMEQVQRDTREEPRKPVTRTPAVPADSGNMG
jgi:hypothetical protein